MSKIQFKISAWESKVNAIKTLRLASGLGLKEAKDLVDQFFHHDMHHGATGKTMIMNAAQFGILMALQHKADTNLSVWDVEMMQHVPALDISGVTSSHF